MRGAPALVERVRALVDAALNGRYRMAEKVIERRIERYRAFAADCGNSAVALAMFASGITNDGIEAAVAFAEEAGHFANLVLDLSTPPARGWRR